MRERLRQAVEKNNALEAELEEKLEKVGLRRYCETSDSILVLQTIIFPHNLH